MRTTIDRSGRLVVPKALRRRLDLEDGGDVELTENDGVIEIRPVSHRVDVTWTAAGLPVAVAPEAPPLTDAVVRDTLESLRR